MRAFEPPPDEEGAVEHVSACRARGGGGERAHVHRCFFTPLSHTY